MIKKEDLAIMEKAFGLKEGDLSSAIADAAEKPLPIAIDTFEIIPKTDYATRIDNIQKVKYDEGKLAGTEMTVKEIKTAFGLDVAKTIPIAELTTTIKTKVIDAAKLPVDEKVKELTRDLEAMTGQKKEWETKYTGLNTEFAQKEKQRKITTTVMGVLPKFGDKPGDFIIPVEDGVEIILNKAAKRGITIDIDETHGVVFKKDGAILKDNNLVPLKGDVVLKDDYQPFVKPNGGGSGGGDNGGAPKAGTWAAFLKEMNDAGIKENTMKFNEERNKRIADKTLTI